MGKLDRLIQDNPNYSVSLIHLLRKFDPSDSGKFMPFLVKQTNDKFNEPSRNMDDETRQIIDTLLPKGNPVDKFVLMILYHMLGKDNLYALWEFNKHLTDNRVEQKDILKYESWADVTNAVMMSELKLKEKEYQKQTAVLLDTGDWLVLKPLSFGASLTYGSGTKWCTVSRNNPTYFYDYCNRGMLVYIINRKTNYKAAMFAEINPHRFKKGTEISFWNTADLKTESMDLNLPDEVLAVLRAQLNDKTQLKPNKYFFAKEELAKSNYGMKSEMVEPMMNQRVDDMVEIDEGEVEEMEEMPDPPAPAPRDLIIPRNSARRPMRDIQIDHPEDRLMPAPGMVRRVAQEVLNEAAEQEMDEDAEELRMELTNEAMLEVAEEVSGIKFFEPEMEEYEKSPKKPTFKTLPLKPKIILGPDVVNIEIPDEFYPAPWLTRLEITHVNQMLLERGKMIADNNAIFTRVAYPNGRVIDVHDRLRNNVIIERTINEKRPGRDESTQFNPFGVHGQPDLSEMVENVMNAGVDMEAPQELRAMAEAPRWAEAEQIPQQEGEWGIVDRVAQPMDVAN